MRTDAPAPATVCGRLVERFYHRVWNARDEAAAWEILDGGFVFRSSLGLEMTGVPAFLDYVRRIHTALADYTCAIEDLIVSDDRTAARVRFSGVHRGALFGEAPTGREVAWLGAAFFTAREGRLAEAWILGDLDALKAQLGA